VRDKVRELITTLSTAASTGLPVAASAAWIRILTTGALAILKRTAEGREGRADCFDGFHCPWEYREVRYLRALWAHGQAEQVDRRAQEKVGLSDRGFLQSPGRTVADRLKKDLGLAPLVVDAVPGHAQLELAKTYTPSDPIAQMRDALKRWSIELANILKARRRTRQRP